MKTKHTDGPWTIRREPKEFKAVIECNSEFSSKWIATCPMPPFGTELHDVDEANAALIAAAPELLEALEECLAWFELDPQRNRPIMAQDTEVGFRMIQQAGAAIAKAKGQQ
jgi:hypothetical protein